MASRSIFALFLAALFVLASATGRRPPPRDPCFHAFLQCRFRFMGISGVPTFRIGGPPDRAFTPRIISKNPHEVIGVLNTNDVVPEFILRSGAAVRITHFGSPRFTPTHFKPFTIPMTMGSGVGHQTFQGNQLHVARGQCVRVFFTTFQVLRGVRPPTVANVNVGREAFKCVVFRTK